MAAWPSSLPDYQEIGLQETRQQAFLRSSVDAGPSKQRKRFTSATRSLSGTMLLSDTQFAAFNTFYETTINQGADEFDMLDPRDGSTAACRFVEPPTARALVGGSSGAALWRVSFKLEIVN